MAPAILSLVWIHNQPCTLNFSDGARMRLGNFLCEGHSRRSYGDNGKRFSVDGEFLHFLLQ